MTALEDRIRAGLSADRAVPDLYDAVHRDARRLRARRTTGVVAAAVMAVVAVAAGITVSLGDEHTAPPVNTPTQTPTQTETVPRFPGAGENVMSTAASGDRVFVLTESHTLWTYAGGEWTAQKDLPIPKQQLAAIDFSPNGRNGLIQPQDWTGDASGAFAVTTDGGRTWSRGIPPVACGCGATATDTGFFYLAMASPTGVSIDPAATGFYKSADGRTEWVQTGPAPSSSALSSNLFARGNDLVAYIAGYQGGDFAVSSDEGRDWSFLPHPCRALGRGFEAAYTFDTGLATGEEIVVNCHPGDATTIETKHERSNQVVHTVDLARWEPIGPPVSSTLCCFPISDDAAVGADLLVTPDGIRHIDLPLETRFWGAHASRSGGATYLAFFGQLWLSYDDGLTWTQLTQ